MFKLAPLLAFCFMSFAGSSYIVDMHKQFMKDIKVEDLGKLDILHHLSAGFKAVYTKACYEGMDACRQSCGGAGFNAYSGIPSKL